MICFYYINKILIKCHLRALLHTGDAILSKTDLILAFIDWIFFSEIILVMHYRWVKHLNHQVKVDDLFFSYYFSNANLVYLQKRRYIMVPWNVYFHRKTHTIFALGPKHQSSGKNKGFTSFYPPSSPPVPEEVHANAPAEHKYTQVNNIT